jgi:hypothetical protein
VQPATFVSTRVFGSDTDRVGSPYLPQ